MRSFGGRDASPRGGRVVSAAKKSDEEKVLERMGEAKVENVAEKIGFSLILLTVREKVVAAIDVLILVLLAVENYEYAHILVKTIDVLCEGNNIKKLGRFREAFAILLPVVEGLVGIFHTVVFIAEIFFHWQVETALAIAVYCADVACALMIIEREMSISLARPDNLLYIRAVEVLVVLMSALFTVCVTMTSAKYRAFILVSTIMTQFLCRSLYRERHKHESRWKRMVNTLETRLLLGASVLVTLLLMELIHIYAK